MAVSATPWALEGVYLASLLLVAVVMVLRGGSSHAGFIACTVSALLLLHLVGHWRGELTGLRPIVLQLLSTWLNVSLLVGTRLNPFRAALSSADLSRVRGPWRDRSATYDGRFVHSPKRWPWLSLFAGGSLALALVRPDLFF